MSQVEERFIDLENRLERALVTIEKHNILLETLLVNKERHAEEHQFLRELIEEKKYRNEIRKKVLTNLLTTGGVAFLGVLGAAVIVVLRDLFSN